MHSYTRTAKISLIFIALIVTLALTACPADTNSGETPTARSAGTEKTLAFGGKVTIKSDDKFTNAEWNTLCDKVVTAIQTACVGVGYKNLFAAGQNAAVVFGNSFSHNWEIKAGEYRIMYIKTASIDTVDFTEILMYMENNTAGFA